MRPAPNAARILRRPEGRHDGTVAVRRPPRPRPGPGVTAADPCGPGTRRLADPQLPARRHDSVRRDRLARRPLDGPHDPVSPRHDPRHRSVGRPDHLSSHQVLIGRAMTALRLTATLRSPARPDYAIMSRLDPQRTALPRGFRGWRP